MSWETILHDHTRPLPPLPPLPSHPPAWSQGRRPLHDGVMVLAQPDRRRRCALCRRRGVVATDGVRVACVRCMVELGEGARKEVAGEMAHKAPHIRQNTPTIGPRLKAAGLLASVCCCAAAALLLGGWLLWPGSGAPPVAMRALPPHLWTSADDAGLPALPVGAHGEERTR
jgi:hypothetical protein